MPIIPMYDSPQVQIAPIATPRATPVGPDAFGAGIGKGLGELAGAAEYAQKVTDHNDLLGARKSLTDAAKDVLYSTDTDPDTGVVKGLMFRQGDDAQGVGQQFEDDMRAKVGEISDQLSGDTLKNAFSVMAGHQITQLATAAHEHEFKQKMAATKMNTDAVKEQALQMTAVGFDSPEVVQNQINNGFQAIKSQMLLDGYGPDSDVTRSQLELFESQVHKTVVNSLIGTGRIGEAKRYFDDWKDADGGSVFTAHDSLELEHKLRPLSDAQEVATAAKDFYKPGETSMVDAFADVDKKYDSDPLKAAEVKRSIISMDASYQTAVSGAVHQSANSIYDFINDSKAKTGNMPTWDQVTAMKPDDVANLGKYAAKDMGTIRDAINNAATSANVSSLLSAVDSKLYDLHAQNKYPNAANAEKAIPELGVLKQIDPDSAIKALDHIQSVYQGNVHWQQSLATLSAQQRVAQQEQNQQALFGKIIANPGAIQTVNPVMLKALGSLSPDQAAMIDALKKKNDDMMKGHPVSWSQDQINKTVKGLLGFKGQLSADNEQKVEQASASFGMYLFRLEQANSGPLNPQQVEQAATSWAKTPAYIMPLVDKSTANETTTVDMYKKNADRRLGTKDTYNNVYNAFKAKGVTPTVQQMNNAMRLVNGGGL